MLQQEDISDKELKQRWRLYWIHTVFEFSSLKLQEESWLNIQEPSSFEECISAYFDILALDDAYEKAIEYGNVSQKEANRAKNFHQLLVFYDEPDESAEAILKDPEWHKVVEAAQEFWDFLKNSVHSQREIDLITKLEKDLPRK